jgi:drug/metabolite transporter (DMT)-like permease
MCSWPHLARLLNPAPSAPCAEFAGHGHRLFTIQRNRRIAAIGTPPHNGIMASEPLGFVCAVAFVLFAAVRDVHFAAALQSHSPLHVAVITFTLGSVVFLSALAIRRQGLGVLRPWLREVIAINVTSAVAWICFLYALRFLEPALVQTLWAGSGPLAVIGFEAAGLRLAAPTAIARVERFVQAGIFLSLALVVLVVAAGLSAPQPRGAPMVGVLLALVSGVSITINVLLCKRLNEHGVGPATILAVRFPGIAILAALLAAGTGDTGLEAWSTEALLMVAGAALLLIVAPMFVNQISIALAAPITIRVVTALGPVLVFLLELAEGRLGVSGYSLAVIILYSGLAILATGARRWFSAGLRPGAAGTDRRNCCA